MKFTSDLELAKAIAALTNTQGGSVYYVGGFVRDQLLQRDSKDVDIEVHGITAAQLEAILQQLGEPLQYGASFGIYGMRGHTLDISLSTAPSPQQAAARRDLTINAMMQDVLTGEILDFFGGRADLAAKTLRRTSDEAFVEDPLRVLRTAQFAARFGFTIAAETLALCRRLSLKDLPKERIEGEVQKALLKSARPSVFFEALRSMHQLSDWFPELEALIDVPQNPVHHPEGDVWTHTMLTLDAAATLRDHASQPYAFLLSALVHDYGKAVCTEEKNGVLHAYRHEVLGLPLVETFLQRLTDHRKVRQYVLNMTELHMKPNACAAQNSSRKSTNHLFDRACSPEDLLLLARADHFGRTQMPDYTPIADWLAERLRWYQETMAAPFVAGSDLIAAGIRPNAQFSELLEYAHKLRLANVAKADAMPQVMSFARQLGMVEKTSFGDKEQNPPQD